MKLVASALIASVLSVTTVAFANTSEFTAADTDEDGKISLAEAMAAYPGTVGDAFEESDTDQNGFLDAEEFDEALESGMLTK